MFIPPHFRIEDRDTLLDFIEEYGFATLVSTDASGVPFATHLPLLLDRAAGVLLGHVSRGNPHWQMFADRESLAVFHGPHAYVSPTWYATHPAVPTWNYAAVHVYGTPRLLTTEQTGEVVDRLTRKYEGGRATPWPGELPDRYREGMLAGIVGFELPLTRVEGKFKLGQNRSAADRIGTVANLKADGPDAEQLAAFTAGHLGMVDQPG